MGKEDLSIKQVAANLRALTDAVEHPGKTGWQGRLVSDLTGKSVNSSRFSLLRLIYRIIRAVLFKLKLMESRQAANERVLKRTYTGLEKICQGIKEADRSTITQWNNYLQPALREAYRNLDKMQGAFGTVYGKEDYNASLLNQSMAYYKWCKDVQHYYDLASAVNTPFPEKAIEKLAYEKELDEKEGRELDAWIKEIDEAVKVKTGVQAWISTSRLNVRYFHKGLKYFFEYFVDPHTERVSLVEAALKKRGLKLLDYPDAVHLEKRKRWVEQKKIEYTTGGVKTSLELGPQLNPTKLMDQDACLVCEHGTDASKVVLIPWNRAIPLVQFRAWEEHEQKGWMLPLIKLYPDLSCPDAGFIVADRLRLRLSTYHWEEIYHLDDKPALDQITKYVQWLVEKGYTPDHLTAHDIGWKPADKTQLLTDGFFMTTKPYTLSQFHFLKLIQMIHDWANQTPWVVQHIIQNTPLKDRAEVKYFADIVDQVSKGESLADMRPRDETMPHLEELKKRGDALAAELQLVMEETVRELNRTYVIEDIDPLRTQIGLHIKSEYAQAFSIATVPQKLKENVVLAISKTGVYPMQEAVLKPKVDAMKAAYKQSASHFTDNGEFYKQGIYHPSQIQQLRPLIIS